MTNILKVTLFLFSISAFAQSNECTPDYIDAVNAKCDSAETTMRTLDRNIASVAASRRAAGINDGASAQLAGLKAELESFPALAESCADVARDCMKTCAQLKDVCDKVKLQATAMAIQIGSMERAYAQTQAVDRATEIHVASNNITCNAWASNGKGSFTSRPILVPGSAPSVQGFLKGLGGQGLPAGFAFTGGCQ